MGNSLLRKRRLKEVRETFVLKECARKDLTIPCLRTLKKRIEGSKRSQFLLTLLLENLFVSCSKPKMMKLKEN